MSRVNQPSFNLSLNGPEVVKLLVKAGVDVSAKEVSLNICGFHFNLSVAVVSEQSHSSSYFSGE